jgi:hypothetical protein
MSLFGETATNRVNVIIQRSLSEEPTEGVQMQEKLIHGDRGYNDARFL